MANLCGVALDQVVKECVKSTFKNGSSDRIHLGSKGSYLLAI